MQTSKKDTVLLCSRVRHTHCKVSAMTLLVRSTGVHAYLWSLSMTWNSLSMDLSFPTSSSPHVALSMCATSALNMYRVSTSDRSPSESTSNLHGTTMAVVSVCVRRNPPMALTPRHVPIEHGP